MDDPFLRLLDKQSVSNRTKVVVCFDDGHKDSCNQIAALFEKYGLRAVFAVLSDQRELKGVRLGDWDLWNHLRSRGHFIHPHGKIHSKLGEMSLSDATAELEQCLNRFAAELHGFAAPNVCFHYPHNRGNDLLNTWLLERVAAVRLAPQSRYDGHNTSAQITSRILYCTTHGHSRIMMQVENAKRTRPYAWIIALHGIDEGWGKLSYEALERLLTMILAEQVFDCLNCAAS